MISAYTLRQIANKANADKAAKAAVDNQRQLEKQRLENEENVAKAASVVGRIGEKAKAAAEKGESQVKVMTVKDWEIKDRTLSGVSKLVWDYCEGAGLNPFFQDNHDGMGIKSWTDLYIRW